MDIDHMVPADADPRRGRPSAITGLVDAKAMAKKHPRTFFVPKIRKIPIGSFVKVARQNERFWLRVTGYEGRKYHGTIASELEENDDLEKGQNVYFAKKNVYDVAL
jgi:uncharacterized protein YegJ (DUF2314 family)